MIDGTTYALKNSNRVFKVITAAPDDNVGRPQVLLHVYAGAKKIASTIRTVEYLKGMLSRRELEEI